MFLKTNLCLVNNKLMVVVRNLTSTEISTALRPFYFSVHPDLFGQHPKEREINETSLQQLSSLLQTLQAAKYLPPITLPFYVKNRNSQDDATRLIKVNLRGRDIGTAIVNILKSCDLPTTHVQHYVKTEDVFNKSIKSENIEHDENEWVRVRYRHDIDFTEMDKKHPLYHTFMMQQKMKEAKDNLRLKEWLKNNFKDAMKKSKSGIASTDEILRLKQEMIKSSKLKDIKWECGWNSQHFRGCLLALKSLMDEHPQHMRQLEDHILIFSYFTGISLDGHIMLFSGEVRHNWLDFIKNIRKHKAALDRVPYYEKSLSHVLRNIKVARRKFMPDMKVGEYEINLKQLTTSVSDYFGRNQYPKTWPQSLDSYEIVVETDAGPLMVSPTGQFIVPSSLPGPNLISFISTNLEEAKYRANIYKCDKVMEKTLHQQCILEFQLSSLNKDDNITPDLMIKFCKEFLKYKDEIKQYTKDLHVSVSTYYSVLSDGVICIPWNFIL
ncbi:T-cell activation inhibitor, mitochondrial [Anthonomus grandis grandis]|uniref:T-cell activation inhibitor, mitochondrial n=1 Tax=Anthonomus grandis grandis TaxID=2921223 RepID=UPI0021661298|nr:T-cell activation inhibitor, mitochondrial [Anthonomus grandis grandis]